MHHRHESLVHERLSSVAGLDPDRAAIVTRRRTVTYGELAAAARRLSQRLLDGGLTAGDRVGIHLDRSIEAVVAMVASLRCGAAYVPLPPAYPPARLRFMLDDSGAELLLTSRAHADPPIRPHLGVTVLDVHDVSDPSSGLHEPRRVPVLPDDDAYVIYTSGSTGTPKGVVVTHAGIANLVHPDQTYVRFAPDETFLQFAPLAFDASAFEIWGALANGARLVLAPPSYEAIDELPQVLHAHGVTTLLLTPPLFHAIMARHPEALDGVRRLIVGGDAMSVTAARAYVERARSQRATRSLSNVYGPTEATTLVSCYPVDDIPADGCGQLPLGRPVAGAALYLLDADLRPVPVGQVGEIHIGGIAVARGYHNRPQLTAERFRPDPFTDRPGARMFATGDLGRLDDAGLITFLGRADDQIKVRGHRVEPGEVEHVLERHPAVDQACVVLVRTAAGAEHLVAHVSSCDPATAGPTTLHDHAAAALPPDAVPARYVLHAALPLTPTGKVDRVRLRNLGPELDAPAHATAPSLSEDEREMAEIWHAVLELDVIEVDDDFFALGGDSLLAMALIHKAKLQGRPLTMRLLYTHPTIRRLCEHLPRPAPV